MIAGRETELSYLEGLYSKSGLQTCSVLGRRGVGKSTIIEEFCDGKRHIYLQFVEYSRMDNVMILNLVLSRFLEKEVPQYQTLTEYFELISELCEKDKTILVLDEFPYLLKWMPEASSVVQRFLDRSVKHTDTMVIICGSVATVMKNETENMSRPLYGRFKSRLLVKPLDIRMCTAFHERMPLADQASVFLTVGGIPRYQEKMDRDSYEECILSNYVLDTADMKEAGPEFIRNEIEDAKMHVAAVSCIANGSVRQKDIAEKLGIDSSYCKKILDELEEVDIIRRLNPMFNAPKKPAYYIEDSIVAFHFSVITRTAPLTVGSKIKAFDMIKHFVDTYLGLRFELLCRDFLLGNYAVKDIGKWWGKVDSQYTDIDIVAKIMDENGLVRNVFCECKYSVNPMGFGVLNTLQRRVGELRVDNPVYALFSSSGFEGDLGEYAVENGILLFDLDSIFGRKEIPRIS